VGRARRVIETNAHEIGHQSKLVCFDFNHLRSGGAIGSLPQLQKGLQFVAAVADAAATTTAICAGIKHVAVCHTIQCAVIGWRIVVIAALAHLTASDYDQEGK